MTDGLCLLVFACMCMCGWVGVILEQQAPTADKCRAERRTEPRACLSSLSPPDNQPSAHVGVLPCVCPDVITMHRLCVMKKPHCVVLHGVVLGPPPYCCSKRSATPQWALVLRKGREGDSAHTLAFLYTATTRNREAPARQCPHGVFKCFDCG